MERIDSFPRAINGLFCTRTASTICQHMGSLFAYASICVCTGTKDTVISKSQSMPCDKGDKLSGEPTMKYPAHCTGLCGFVDSSQLRSTVGGP